MNNNTGIIQSSCRERSSIMHAILKIVTSTEGVEKFYTHLILSYDYR